MTTELLPCPFCGMTPILHDPLDTGHQPVECPNESCCMSKMWPDVVQWQARWRYEVMTTDTKALRERRGQCGHQERVLDTTFYCVENWGHQCAHSYHVSISDAQRFADRATKAEAELERYRAALAAIERADPSKWEPDVRGQFREWAQNIARATLRKSNAPD